MGAKITPARWPITGECGLGFHEGEKHRNYREQPMAFCRGQWLSFQPGMPPYEHVCKCECHEKITEMYAEFDRERIWPVTGKWWTPDDPGIIEQPKFWGPWNDPSWTVVKPTSRVTASEVEEKRAEEGDLSPDEKRLRKAIEFKLLPPNPDYVTGSRVEGVPDEKSPEEIIRAMGLTPKASIQEPGSKDVRRAGQLEHEVKKVCDLFTLGLMPHVFQLTCSEISRAINPEKPPSTGAITNVLIRWDEVGFAIHGKSPHHFGGYTPEGIELGVAAMMAKRDRSERAAKATAARGTIRPREPGNRLDRFDILEVMDYDSTTPSSPTCGSA